MHGVTKADLTDERKKLIAKNIKLYKELNGFVLSQKKKGVFDEEMLAKCSKILSINCEHYTVWNYRREILLHLFANECKSESEQGRLLKNECDQIKKTLQRNPKSYSSFAHRIWCIEQDKFGSIDLSKELMLCSEFLALDSRNFHCWDYRRYIAKKLGQKRQKDEVKYTKQLIIANFSNYSAWHYRSTLIPIVCKGNAQKLKKRLLKELDFVKNAFYTEPNDQSAWLYHRWLLNELSVDELKKEFDAITNFLSIEPSAKWALFTLCLLIKALNAQNCPVDDEKQQINDAIDKLIKIDALRRAYYLDFRHELLKKLK